MTKEELKSLPVFDNLGQQLKPGAKVVFNLSGYLALGEIVSAHVTKRRTVTYFPGEYRNYDIRIRLVGPMRGHEKGHVSKVTNPRSVIVVPEHPITFIDGGDPNIPTTLGWGRQAVRHVVNTATGKVISSEVIP